MHTLSITIPVYQGARTLPGLLAEIAPMTVESTTPDGHAYVVTEVLLVFDHGPDESDQTLRELAAAHPYVKPVWLSRNFGQHAATLAGMASSGGDWIVTMDEDGQHDPAYVPAFLDTALREGATLVYSRPTNEAPHGAFRNAASGTTKWLFSRVLGRGSGIDTFQSYRLVLGEIGRSVAAYAGAGVFLDVALSWVNPRTTTCDVVLRAEGGRASGYSTRRLLSHFWRLVLSSGTRGLRVVSLLGVVLASLGALLALVVVIAKVTSQVAVQGYTSVMVVSLIGSGAVLFALGIIAEYVGVAVNMAMGRPLYLIVSDPARGPLGRRPGS